MNHQRAAAARGVIGAALALTVLAAPAAHAYTVTTPNVSHNWKAYGPQTITWRRADTDPTSFDVVLTNANRTVLPHDVVIAQHVDGTRGSTQVFPPRGGFPTGAHFRVNFVKDSANPATVYAQSDEFSISH